jgi:hypothetical protein
MSLQLTFGGGEVRLVRDVGTASAVQGFRTAEITICKNTTALATTFIFQAFNFTQFLKGVVTNTIIWLKVLGVWKQTTPFIKVSGVWKQATPFIKINGTWK